MNLSTISKRIAMTKHQLSWTKFIPVVLSKIAMKLFDRQMIPSFSQFGEDRIIENIFGNKTRGFYVDVGCNLPITYSNTWKLYLKGWHGIAIDANPNIISEYQKVRPKDIAVSRVISNKNETVEFYFSNTSHLISGIGEKSEGHWKRSAENSNIVKCKSAKLYDILQEHSVSHDFDLLTIDTEGNELQVLESIDLDTFRPSLIVVEIHNFDFSNPGLNSVYKMLSKRGYRIKSYTNPTAFFVLCDGNG